MQVKSKVWLEKDGEMVFGLGKAAILSRIEETGSINQAAKELKMSYRHAWSYIKSAEKRLGQPLVICAKGGANGGSTRLTPHARELLKKFDQLERRVTLSVNQLYRQIF